MADDLNREFLDALSRVRGKRPRTVIDHILKHGHITTEELEQSYGYKHPPRAARDVREAGIPLETFRVRGSHGRMIAAYRFGDPSKIQRDKLQGRRTFSKALRNELYQRARGRCEVCSTEYEERYLQIDHAVPYEVAGDIATIRAKASSFLLLCGSCQRAKSWSCEHCDNGTSSKQPAVCGRCYWGNPTEFDHIALRNIRRLELVWADDEVQTFDQLAASARKKSLPLADYVKQVLSGAETD